MYLTYRNTPSPTHTHTNRSTHHPHTHIKHEQHCACLRRNIFSVSHPVFPLRYEAVVSSSRKFPHNSYSCIVTATRHVVWFYVWRLLFYTMLHFYTPTFLYTPAIPQPLSNRFQSTHTGTITNGTMAHSTAQHSTATVCCTAVYRNVTFQQIAVY